jgi:acetolactate synthase-1/2/3 large subunit
MNVANAIARWFAEAGIEHYFGYAGGGVWPILDALIDHPDIQGIQAKVESHAVHMADVYYRTSGKLAPVLVTKGPGLLNCVGGVAGAMNDSAAVMVLAASGPTHFFGKGGMQEIYFHGYEDAVNVFRPVTKGTWLVVRPDAVIEALNQAYKVATSGRPGPVFVQIPYDIQMAEVDGEVEGPRTRSAVSRPRPDAESMGRVVDLLKSAERPVLVAGGGTVLSGAANSLKRAVETLHLPFVTTMTAKGIVSEEHPLSLAVAGRSGSAAADRAAKEADLLIAVGARFSDNHTSNWRAGKVYDVPTTKLVQVDIDLAEVARNYPVAVGISADARMFLDDLVGAATGTQLPDHSAWIARIERYRRDWEDEIRPAITAETDPIHPARLCHETSLVLGDRGRVVVDMGDVTQYAEVYFTARGPGSYLVNPGLAMMGWAVSGAPGALAADPSRPTVVLCGDGAFNMVSQVVATATEYALPIVWVIFDNHELGIERKGSFNSYQRVHPWMSMKRIDTGETFNPDYVKLAEANGGIGMRVERAADYRPALEAALVSGRPTVIDVEIDTSVPSYFTKGIDRAYPNRWAESYPGYGLLKVASGDHNA